MIQEDDDWERERYFQKKYVKFLFEGAHSSSMVQSLLNKSEATITFIRHLKLSAWAQHFGLFFHFRYDPKCSVDHIKGMAELLLDFERCYEITVGCVFVDAGGVFESRNDFLTKISFSMFSDAMLKRFMNHPFSFALKYLVNEALN